VTGGLKKETRKIEIRVKRKLRKIEIEEVRRSKYEIEMSARNGRFSFGF
jgi:hypothetical protein